VSFSPGLVSKTLHTSLVDGPGNRFVVFLQGCNFNCFNCHNPHTINVCNNCGDCIPACPQDALAMVDDRVVFNESTCDGCDRCLEVCEYDSNPMVAWRAVDDLLAELEVIAGFVSGITVTGGEPTMQLDFLADLFAETQRRFPGLTTFLDSNGHLPIGGWSLLSPSMDGAMIDLKATSSAIHRQITGLDNDLVLDSIRHLSSIERLHEVRHLIIEGLTDSEHEIAAMAAFLRTVNPDVRLRLMAYRHHGVRPAGREWPETSVDAMNDVEARLRDLGLTNLVLSVPVA
jgi:pyruvate formate lyase activating enzyme